MSLKLHLPAGDQLLKGLEEEVYVGTLAGDPLPLSPRVLAAMPDYAREPDGRIVEYITQPGSDYSLLREELLDRRRRLRCFLATLGGYTLIPGASLSLGDTGRFFRSKLGDPYHDYIERAYGTSVNTTSTHINVGLSEPDLLLRACRLLRLEACLHLALSACSPFLDGKVTGLHSTRWLLFPQTPASVPLFVSHAHYVSWVERQLASGAMQNIRHLWLSVRPNGVSAPDRLQRLELRICDRIDDLDLVVALTALLEARIWQLLENPRLDPLVSSQLPGADRLLELAAQNERAVAHQSLEAPLHHWRDGKALSARQWLCELLTEVTPVAEAHGFGELLAPLWQVLEQGNTAQRWLRRHAAGESVREIISAAGRQLAELEATGSPLTGGAAPVSGFDPMFSW